MGSSLKHTSECFHQATKITSAIAAGTNVEIVPSSANGRRIYGIAVFNDNNSIQPLRFFLVNGGQEYVAFTINAALGAGTNGSTNSEDIFDDNNAAPLMRKRLDANGNAYFDLPAGWSIEMEYYVALSGRTTIHAFGETY